MTEKQVPDLEMTYWAMVQRSSQLILEKDHTLDANANQVIIALDRAARLVSRDLEEQIHKQNDHTWPTFRLFFALWLYESMTSNEAADITGMTRSQVSNLTRELQEDGYIEKSKSNIDARSIVLSLSPKGEQYISNVYREQNRIEAEWANALTPIEQKLFVMLLDKLVAGPRGPESKQKEHD